MKTFEVKFKMLVLGNPPTISTLIVKAPTPEKAKAIAWGQVYSSKPSNGAKAKLLSVTTLQAG